MHSQRARSLPNIRRADLWRTVSALVTLFLFLQVSCAAEAVDSRSPTDRYRGDSIYTLMMCRIAVFSAETDRIAGTARSELSDYVSCINRARQSNKANLDIALRSTSTVKVQEALKSYHVVLSVALEAVTRSEYERTDAYERRQRSNDERLTEAWARVEVEQ